MFGEIQKQHKAYERIIEEWTGVDKRIYDSKVGEKDMTPSHFGSCQELV